MVWLIVLWSCSRLEVLGKRNIFQSTAEGQNVSRRWAGLGWAGQGRQGFGKPLLVLRAVQNTEVSESCVRWLITTVAALRRRDGLVPNALGSVGKVEVQPCQPGS